MDSVLRKLGLKKGDSKESDTRKRLQKELFAFQKGLDYGFPHKPSAIAYDPTLSFLAIGTSSGLLRVYGTPGVQFVSQHSSSSAVNQIVFLPEQARLVTRCEGNSLHLWEMNTKDGNPTMDEVKTFKLDTSKAKNVTFCCVSSNGDEILLGTDSGAVYVLDLATFDLSSKSFTSDILLEKASEDFKTNPGAIELILQHPVTPEKFLIGFGRGFLVLLDAASGVVDQTFNTSQQLESAAFKGTDEFVTSHTDGSYVVWKTSDGSQPKEMATTPYGKKNLFMLCCLVNPGILLHF
jgi:lethal(2) giant larvae protein